MNPSTLSQDEFFPDAAEAVPVQSEHLTVLRRVVPKAEFTLYAGTLTDTLLVEQSAIEAYVRIRNVADILDMALGLAKERGHRTADPRVAATGSTTKTGLGARTDPTLQ